MEKTVKGPPKNAKETVRNAKFDYLTGQGEESIRNRIDDVFGTHFLLREPPFKRTGDAEFISDYYLVKSALDAFYEVDAEMRRPHQPEDLKMHMRWLKSNLEKIREPIDAILGEESKAKLEAYHRETSKRVRSSTKQLDQAAELLSKINNELGETEAITNIGPDKMNEMMTADPKKFDAYLKIGGVLRKTKIVAELFEKELQTTSNAINTYLEGSDKNKENVVKALNMISGLDIKLANTRETVAIILDSAKEIDSKLYSHTLAVYNTLRELSEVASKVKKDSANIRAVEMPVVKSLEPAKKARFKEIDAKFPLLTEYKKVIKYGETLKTAIKTELGLEEEP